MRLVVETQRGAALVRGAAQALAEAVLRGKAGGAAVVRAASRLGVGRGEGEGVRGAELRRARRALLRAHLHPHRVQVGGLVAGRGDDEADGGARDRRGAEGRGEPGTELLALVRSGGEEGGEILRSE